MRTTTEKFETFKALHAGNRPFVMPNPWDAGTARLLAALGFEALATTSAGLAFALGTRDSAAALSRAEILENARSIVNATDLPVSADLENGFGDAPEDCAETIRLAADTGLVGGSIEDATGNPANPIYAFELAVERVRAAAAAKADRPFMLTARCENFLWGKPDLDDTIRRLQAFEAAGADVLYAPGLPDLKAIEKVCMSVGKPVNVLSGLKEPSFSVAELAECGVTRISTGGSLARAALGALKQAAEEIMTHGTFEYHRSALSGADAERLTSGG
ncbi:isocitrate lyase/PEP mutase family protein [Martelella endophytica]|uniref:2-methylisocitrate lyase n=1 Tax=Martelella endophytica TaxID=1486262 RepID=A0A0D5LRP8_MAREN|nr:isocitrate lyase/phosphoenolpyruvate mutase family protein [Martelella endophytica]AJY46023.1 2-methylisocitrate lyase [Martelella endophytica]